MIDRSMIREFFNKQNPTKLEVDTIKYIYILEKYHVIYIMINT